MQSRRACVPVATAVTRYVNALPDVSITQTNIGQVMRDATEFPVLAYRVDQREFMESSSCFFVTEGRPASMHVQFKGSEPHENLKIKKICSHEKSQNEVHEKSLNENKEFFRYRCSDVHERCLNKESGRIASRIARFFPKKGRSTDR